MLDEDKQVSLTNYAMIDTDPLGRSERISEFEKEILLNFVNTLTVGEILNSLPEDVKQATLEDPDLNLQEDQTLEVDDDSFEFEVVNSNFFYDSIKITFNKNDQTFVLLLKISLDATNQKLSRERDILKSVSDDCSPSLITYRNDESTGLEFLCTSWENGENFDMLGIADLKHNFGTFACIIDSIHESDTTDCISFLDNFAENESIVDSFESADELDVEIFKKLTGLSLSDISNIFAEIRNKHLIRYNEDIPVLSHANVQKSNILYQSEYIKIINYENSHVSDIYYSLLKVANNLYLYKNLTLLRRFLTKYHQHSNLLKDISLGDFLSKYEEKRDLNKILLFQELFSKTVFHFAAYGPFVKKEKLEHYMNLYLNIKPSIERIFPQYIDSFDKLFFTCMPTIKTYDMEELKAIAEMYE